MYNKTSFLDIRHERLPFYPGGRLVSRSFGLVTHHFSPLADGAPPDDSSSEVRGMALPKVVIVGRPNVGKSSLLNWLAGRRIAIVDDLPGVTRDRVGALVQLGDDENPRFFELIDTGGIGMVDRDDLSEDVDRQIDKALNEASLILFVVDIREELMPLDEEVAQRLRYLKTPVILVMNKADYPEIDQRGGEFYKLGRGKPIPVSSQQNRNRKALLKMIEEMLPSGKDAKPAEAVMKIAVVGRPNPGKSTFINTLAHAERMIGRADVVLMLIDPTQGITRLDKQLADYIAKEYKPCIFTINKWDLMLTDRNDPSQGNMARFANVVQHAFRNMSYMPLAFITAQTGKNVKALLNLGQSLYKQANRRVGTGALNRVLREAIEAHPPAMSENRTPRVYYATQVGTNPPTIVLFVNSTRLFDPTYQRYLLNVFREQLPFHDIPIKLYLRARKQTEPDTHSAGNAGRW